MIENETNQRTLISSSKIPDTLFLKFPNQSSRETLRLKTWHKCLHPPPHIKRKLTQPSAQRAVFPWSFLNEKEPCSPPVAVLFWSKNNEQQGCELNYILCWSLTICTERKIIEKNSFPCRKRKPHKPSVCMYLHTITPTKWTWNFFSGNIKHFRRTFTSP